MKLVSKLGLFKSDNAGGIIPNKEECLQVAMNKTSKHNVLTGFYEWEDKIGKVNKTPNEGACYKGTEADGNLGGQRQGGTETVKPG